MQSTRFRHICLQTLVVGVCSLGALWSPGSQAQTLAEQEKQWQSCEAAHSVGPREGRRNSNPVDRANSNIVCDQTGVLTVFYSSKDYPAKLRRVVAKDHSGKRITFLTYNFALKPELIADLYRQRWQVESFFKWIKLPAHQDVLWHQRERCQNANLDRGLHLRADRHC